MFRDFRSLFPLFLVGLGLIIIVFAEKMPLFEWQISEPVTDLSSTYKVHLDPSPWPTQLGEALDNYSYFFSQSYRYEGWQGALGTLSSGRFELGYKAFTTRRGIRTAIAEYRWIFSISVTGDFD